MEKGKKGGERKGRENGKTKEKKGGGSKNSRIEAEGKEGIVC